MDYLLFPFRIIYKIYYLLVFSIVMMITFPLYYLLLKNPRNYPLAFKIMRVHALLVVVFAGVIMKVKGKENIPEKGSFIICPNHTSFLDAFCLYHLFRRYFVFVGKKEIEKWPLFHIFYTSGMNIMVDRSSVAGSFAAIKRMSKEIDNGNPLMIFPEGTRPKNPPNLGPFKPGAFSIAIQKQIPILPVSFVSNWKRLGIGGMLKGKAGPGISEVIIHKPVNTIGLKKDDTEILQEKVKTIINGPLENSRGLTHQFDIYFGHFPKVSG